VITYDEADLHNAAVCAWKESRGDGQLGIRATLHVLANRVGAVGFPGNLHDVIYQKNAFTSMSVSSDPEYCLDPTLATGLDLLRWTYAQGVVQSVMDDTDPDLTNGARYYARLDEVTSGWFYRHIVQDSVSHPLVATIGKQSFFK
jgi:spore germination cell wall hydrolase CwlJ-like protein